MKFVCIVTSNPSSVLHSFDDSQLSIFFEETELRIHLMKDTALVNLQVIEYGRQNQTV